MVTSDDTIGKFTIMCREIAKYVDLCAKYLQECALYFRNILVQFEIHYALKIGFQTQNNHSRKFLVQK